MQGRHGNRDSTTGAAAARGISHGSGPAAKYRLGGGPAAASYLTPGAHKSRHRQSEEDQATPHSPHQARPAGRQRQRQWDRQRTDRLGRINGSSFFEHRGRDRTIPGHRQLDRRPHTERPGRARQRQCGLGPSEMIVWGGLTRIFYTGGRLNPHRTVGQQTSTTARPMPREFPTAVWTGANDRSGADLMASSILTPAGGYNTGTDRDSYQDHLAAPEQRTTRRGTGSAK